MKFACLTEIYAPRDKVIELWTNPENLKHWQDGFISYKQLAGHHNAPGSKKLFHYNSNGRSLALEETIIENKLPDNFEGEYVHIKMTNRMRSTFVALDEKTTIWKAEIHYTKFNGFVMKIFGKLAGKVFQKQTQKWLDNFKSFVEKGK